MVGSIINPWHTRFTSEDSLMRPFGESLRQYINVDQDLDGRSNRVPEYGRKICFRARVVQKNGESDKLSEARVTFTYIRTDGPNRSNPVGGQDVWRNETVQGRRKEGFSRENGRETISVRTDSEGWTRNLVVFYTSEYGGDQFMINAKLHRNTEGSADGESLSTENYQVWRRFWYQITHAEGHPVARPENSEAAYAEVFAEMVMSKTKEFTKEDLPSALQDKTFLPEYMFKVGAGERIVVNVSEVNVREFHRRAQLNLERDNTKYPIIENLIVCEYYCGTTDQRGGTLNIEITSPEQLLSLAIPAGAGGKIISKPAVNTRRALVRRGVWRTKNRPRRRGRITDDNITIDKDRTSTLRVTVTLPAEAPVPTVNNPISLTLNFETCDEYLGLTPEHGLLAVYDPLAPAEAGKSVEDFNNTASHEFGHKWSQTPIRRTARRLKMKEHPFLYQGHGDWGSHCRNDARPVDNEGVLIPDDQIPNNINWKNANQRLPQLGFGSCIMFGSNTDECTNTFCDVCKPYLQLQDMSSFD